MITMQHQYHIMIVFQQCIDDALPADSPAAFPIPTRWYAPRVWYCYDYDTGINADDYDDDAELARIQHIA